MAWEISHSADVWPALQRTLEGWSKEALIEAICDDIFEAGNEWTAMERRRHLSEFAAHDSLVDECLTLIEQTNTTDNGGHQFWIDREGYHRVTPATPEEMEEA